MISFGSAQANGLPILLTAITSAARQLIHTAPAGAATPNRVRLFAQNLDTANPQTVYIAVEDAAGTILRLITQNIGLEPGLADLLDDGHEGSAELVLNGACTIKAYAGTASKVAIYAVVDDQSDVAGTSSQTIASGLVAAVRNANRFAVGAQGGVGQATEANAEIIVAKAGILRNLIAFPDAAVTLLANVTVVVRKNGVGTALALAFNNASGVTPQVDTDSVAVAAGDKIDFLITCDDGADPVANFQAAMEYVAA
jgi:hypothetical protein